MEREDYLKEQIESYIDRLDLLGMQETIDEERVKEVADKLKELATEYISLLDEKLESQIQEIEKIFVVTLEEELEKRKKISDAVNKRLDEIVMIFSDIKEIDVASDLWSYISTVIEASKIQVHEYESDVKLVEEQFEKIKKAEKREAKLDEGRRKAHLKKKNLKDRQIPFKVLNNEILDVYFSILIEGKAGQIDFANVKAKQNALEKRQGQLLENLELARSAKDAEGYVKTYEARVRRNQLELDKVAEQTFLHLLRRIMDSPIDSYKSLEERTKTVQGLVSSRLSQVEQLYQEGIVEKETYTSLASTIDHSKIYRQLLDLKELEKNEDFINSIEEQLEHTRDHIKGKEELELIFAERAKERGRVAIIPEAIIDQPALLDSGEEAEILFEDEDGFEGYEDLTPKEAKEDKKRRRQIMLIEPAKKSLLEKVGRARKFLLSTLKTIGGITEKVKEKIEKLVQIPMKYNPTIGDQIELKENASIYTNPLDIAEETDKKDAKELGLTGTKLFVARGVILDYTGTPIYITTDYGADLEAIAKNMSLKQGTYSIALGCSLGDSEGKFVALRDDELNPDIEKGWINAADTNMIILNSLNAEKEKGGMKK